jgi:hypothetical protein
VLPYHRVQDRYESLSLFFNFSLFAWSALRSGKKVTWKGREIHAD